MPVDNEKAGTAVNGDRPQELNATTSVPPKHPVADSADSAGSSIANVENPQDET
jgi:hypothetical protein